MKKLIILIMLVGSTTLSFAQTKSSAKKATPKPSIEVVLNQQVEILNARIDSMNIAHEEAIEMVKNEQKGQYANYYNQLDSDFDRFLVYMSIFWTIIGVILGIYVPFKINKNFEENIKEEVNTLKTFVSNKTLEIDNTTNAKMRNIERITMSRVRERYNDIDQQLKRLNAETSSLNKVKEQLDNIKIKIEASERNAKESEKQAKINSLFLEALKESNENPNKAIELYSKIIQIDDSEIRAYNNRAVAYCENGEFEKAIEDTTKILNINHNSASAYAIRALANTELNNKTEALKDFDNCIRIGTEDEKFMAYESRATFFIKFNMWQEAIKDYDIIAQTRTLTAFELNNRAFAYYRLGKNDIALKDATESIKINDTNAAAYDTLGCIYVAKNMYSEALDNFNKAIDLQQNLWESYENRANLYRKFVDIASSDEEKQKYQKLYEDDIDVVRTKKVKKDDNSDDDR